MLTRRTVAIGIAVCLLGAAPLLASSSSVNQLPQFSLGGPSGDFAFSSLPNTQIDPMFTCAGSLVTAAPSLCGGDFPGAGLPGQVSAAFQLQYGQQSPSHGVDAGLDRPMVTDTRYGFDTVMITVATMVTAEQHQIAQPYPAGEMSAYSQPNNQAPATSYQMPQAFSAGMSLMTMPWLAEFEPEPAPQFYSLDFYQADFSWSYLPEFYDPFYTDSLAIFPAMDNYNPQVNVISPQITIPVIVPVANIVSLTQPDAYSFIVADVPEPATMLLAAAGLALLALKRRRA